MQNCHIAFSLYGGLSHAWNISMEIPSGNEALITAFLRIPLKKGQIRVALFNMTQRNVVNTIDQLT